MITRFALFEGSVVADKVEDFRAAVMDSLVPLWTQFPGNTDVRVMFGEDRDEGAPEFPLILAITYPDRATMTAALDSPARFRSKEVTGEIIDAYFTGRIHHHVMALNGYGG
ncbi:MAG: hypothetical protein AAGE03_11310 [Pseudomonadota bacterium]